MRKAFLLALALFPLALRAGNVQVVSPDTAQTYSFSDVTWHTLRFVPGTNRLMANITFSTYKYVTHYEPRHDESYQFVFPGVKYDRSNSTFYARGPKGQHIAVAELSKDIVGQSIKPLPGTVIHVYKESGKVTVALTATSTPPPHNYHLHWIEETAGFNLNNAIASGVDAMRH